MSNQEWVTEVTGGASLRDIGERIGVHHVTVSRRITEGRAETCVAIARAYDADPIKGLVAWGVITSGEASSGDADLALRGATDLQIAEEMVRRIKAGEATSFAYEPIEGLPIGRDRPAPRTDDEVLAQVTAEDLALAAGNVGADDDNADDHLDP